MSETLHLGLPFIAGAQAQKHITHNEALLKLDGLIHAHVEQRDLTAPPANPQEGSGYLVAPNPTGDWQAHENQIAVFQDGAWAYNLIKVGFVLWVVADELLAVWSGAQWLNFAAVGSVPSQVSELGINATPDITNRLSVSSPAVLFNHVGSDVQHKLNKNAAGDTVSTLFQTGFSGRAEFGLVGDDDLQMKVSSNGVNWKTALKVDNASGTVTTLQKPFVSLSRNTDLSWGSNTTEQLVYETEQGLQGDIGVNTSKSKILIHQDGLYFIAPQIVLSSQIVGSGDGWSMEIRKNGVKISPSGCGTFAPNGFATTGSEMIATYSMVRPLSAGDYVEVFVSSIQSNAKCIGASIDIAHLG